MIRLPQFKSLYYLLYLLFVAACTAPNKQMTNDIEIIQDTYWMLLSLEGEELQGTSNKGAAYIRFEEGEAEVKGFTGCNNFFGKYELNGDSVQLNELGSTRAMCPIIEQENKLLNILEEVDSYSISDYLLTMYSNGNAVATFRAGNNRVEILPEQ